MTNTRKLRDLLLSRTSNRELAYDTLKIYTDSFHNTPGLAALALRGGQYRYSMDDSLIMKAALVDWELDRIE
jgi:hypothetical protein